MISLGNNIFLLKNNKIDNNTYLIGIFDTLIIVDLSWNSKIILDYIKKNNFTNLIFLYTHGHYDHIGEIDDFVFMKENIIIYISKKEKEILLDFHSKSPFNYNLVAYINRIKFYEDDKQLEIHNKKFLFIDTPGHSVGSTSIMFDNYIFTGDFLFADCIGRIDLFTSSEKQMIESCKYFYKNISINFMICPGHGEIEKFKNIKSNNSEFNWANNYEK